MTMRFGESGKKKVFSQEEISNRTRVREEQLSAVAEWWEKEAERKADKPRVPIIPSDLTDFINRP